MRQCPANLPTLTLSVICRDEESNCQMKNLQNPFLLQCSPLMVPRYDVSNCTSWCDFFASGLNKSERFDDFIEQCNSKFLKSYWPFQLEGDLSSITKLIDVRPCGPPRKRSFVINTTICNSTGGGKTFTYSERFVQYFRVTTVRFFSLHPYCPPALTSFLIASEPPQLQFCSVLNLIC